MKFSKIQQFPRSWINIIHCQTKGHYSRYERTNVTYHRTIYVGNKQEWEGIESLLIEDNPNKLVQPCKLYINENKDIVMQLNSGEDSHWFLMKNPYIYAGCNSCDGETSSSFSIYEAIDLHDLVYNCMSEFERDTLQIFILDSFSMQDFYEIYSQEELEDKLFR